MLLPWKRQPSKHIKDPGNLNMTYRHSSIRLIIMRRCMFLHTKLCIQTAIMAFIVSDLSNPIISRTKDKRYQLKMSLKLPLNANLFPAARPSAPSQSLADKEVSNQNKLQHIPRAIQSLIRSILRPILNIISECPTPLPCKLCHGYSNWKCLIKQIMKIVIRLM